MHHGHWHGSIVHTLEHVRTNQVIRGESSIVYRFQTYPLANSELSYSRSHDCIVQKPELLPCGQQGGNS